MKINLLTLGISNQRPRYLNQAIRSSNIIAIILSVVGIVYSVINNIFLSPDLNVISIGLFFAGIITIILNGYAFVNWSRIFLNIATVSLVGLYHAFLIPDAKNQLISMAVSQLVMAMLPWIYIDFREKKILIPSLLISYSAFFAFPQLAPLYTVDIDITIIRSGFLHYMTLLSGFAVLTICFINMYLKAIESENQNEQLLSKAKLQHEESLEKENTLKSTLEEIEETRKLEKKRSWISTGVSKVLEIVRKYGEEKVLYDKVLSEIISYLEASVGGMYLTNISGEGKVKLDLVSSYAYDRFKNKQLSIESGEGLVGQCYMEKMTIAVSSVPENYINISSILGNAHPKTLVIVPLMMENEVEGIIEIASLNEISTDQIEYLESVAQNLGSHIHTDKSSKEARELLAHTRQQAEEMQAQEEEMRQNMEELEATQEEMQRKESEYIKQIEDLKAQLGSSQP